MCDHLVVKYGIASVMESNQSWTGTELVVQIWICYILIQWQKSWTMFLCNRDTHLYKRSHLLLVGWFRFLQVYDKCLDTVFTTRQKEMARQFLSLLNWFFVFVGGFIFPSDCQKCKVSIISERSKDTSHIGYWSCCDCVFEKCMCVCSSGNLAVHYNSLQSWAVKEKRMKHSTVMSVCPVPIFHLPRWSSYHLFSCFSYFYYIMEISKVACNNNPKQQKEMFWECVNVHTFTRQQIK